MRRIFITLFSALLVIILSSNVITPAFADSSYTVSNIQTAVNWQSNGTFSFDFSGIPSDYTNINFVSIDDMTANAQDLNYELYNLSRGSCSLSAHSCNNAHVTYSHTNANESPSDEWRIEIQAYNPDSGIYEWFFSQPLTADQLFANFAPTLTPTATPTPSYTLSGNVFSDVNQNGVKDTGEQGFTGAAVSLNTGQTATTDSNGNYSFYNLQAGTYTETLSVPNGYTATTTDPVNISLSTDTTQNFGIAQANSLVTAINAGGDTHGNFVADTEYSGGSMYTTNATVDTSGVTSPAPEAVYQTVRYGNFSYTISGLTPSTAYTVRLHFNELYWTSAGHRVFNVSANGQQVLSSYDIYQAAGGANKAIVEQVPATTDASGAITLQFTTLTDNAMVNGIEVYTGSLPSPTPTATPTPGFTVNAGGSSIGSFAADNGYTGGSTYTTATSVDTSGVTNPAPEAVYQTVRYGNFTYTIPNLTPNTTHTLRLHFNEMYWTSAGQRVFNVSANGDQVLSNFDIYQVAGGSNKAVVEDISSTADSHGFINLQFSTVTDNAMVNGIQLLN
jgi:hypothetical protein